MPSIWIPISSKKKGPKSTGFSGNAEQLSDYGLTHTSPRVLRALRVEAEVRRARKEGALSSTTEIKARYNFTEEASQSFLKSVQRAMRRKPLSESKVKRSKIALDQSSSSHPLPNNELPTPIVSNVRTAALQAILQDIRNRYSDEIRVHGEQTLVREGFVYLVTHPCFSGWVKAGMTIDFELRMGTYNVSDPLSRFELSAVKWTPDRRSAERELLVALNDSAEEMRGEWARIELAVALSVLESLY